jgi:hypothetical protein
MRDIGNDLLEIAKLSSSDRMPSPRERAEVRSSDHGGDDRQARPARIASGSFQREKHSDKHDNEG